MVSAVILLSALRVLNTDISEKVEVCLVFYFKELNKYANFCHGINVKSII